MAGAVATRLGAIKKHGGIRSTEIAELLNTTPETISRWKSGRTEPQPDHLKNLLALEWLLDRLSELYEADEARVWLYAPHRLLGGDTPAGRIRSGKVEDVLALIAQLLDSAYV